MTTTLVEYVLAHTMRGECQCGQCLDKGDARDPVGHTVDMVFFKVAAVEHPDVAVFRALTSAHEGTSLDVDPFDGHEHSYLELGAWLGDQGVAMQFMALGSLLGVFQLLTPYTMIGRGVSPALAMRMAQAGYVSVQSAAA